MSPACTRINIIAAKKIVRCSEHDIDNNEFDPSLQKYKALKFNLSTKVHNTPAIGHIPEATSGKNQYLLDASFDGCSGLSSYWRSFAQIGADSRRVL
jgi:hypothetical protein